jgi:hypothetical protein
MRDEVADLVGEHLEVEAIRPCGVKPAPGVGGEAGLDEPVAAVGVVPGEQRDQRDAVEVVAEVPLDGAAEVAFPDVEDSSDDRVHVRER